jgi:hypothetical protein
MTQHADPMKHLMAALLSEQPEPPEAAPALDQARLQRALTGAEPLTAAEQRLLWTSPAARRRFTALREARQARQYRRWRQAGIDPQVVYRAAADAAVQPIVVDSNPHVTVKLFPLDEQGSRWTVFVKLSETMRRSLEAGIRLRDTGDMEWLTGQVDGDGELSADWPHQESPLQRVHRYGLRVEPL